MQKKQIAIVFLLLIAVFVFVPAAVLATHQGVAHPEPSRLVPECGSLGKATNVCGVCDLFRLVQKVLNFIWWVIAVPLAIIMVVYGGFLMIMPFGNPNLIERGKRVLKNALIGILIIFIAWLAIDTGIKLLAGQNLLSGEPAELPLGPWNKIDCSSGPSLPAFEVEPSFEAEGPTPNDPIPFSGGDGPSEPPPPPPPLPSEPPTLEPSLELEE